MTEKNNTAKENEKGEGEVHYVPYKHIDDTRTIYANHILIQHNDAGEFFLSFFDAPPPIVMGSAEERKKQLADISEQDAHCVARIGLSKERMESVIGALAQNYALFRQRGKDQGAIREEQKHEQNS